MHVLWGRSIHGGLLGDKAFAKFYWLQKASEDVTACRRFARGYVKGLHGFDPGARTFPIYVLLGFNVSVPRELGSQVSM